MWIYSKPRSEHENRFLLNLDISARINLSQLGERWFVEVIQNSELHPVASTTSQEEATELLRRIFEGLKAGDEAIDLVSGPEKKALEREDKPASERTSPSE